MITENDEAMFTRGGCLVLADLISEATGWPVCSLTTEDEPDGPDIHAFVRTPDGKYLDIEGVHTEEEMLDRWVRWDPISIEEYDLSQFDYSWAQRGESWTRDYEVRGSQVMPELLAMI